MAEKLPVEYWTPQDHIDEACRAVERWTQATDINPWTQSHLEVAKVHALLAQVKMEVNRGHQA